MLPFVLLATIWQFATLFFPPYLFPSLIDVFWRCLEILIVDFREELTLDFH